MPLLAREIVTRPDQADRIVPTTDALIRKQLLFHPPARANSQCYGNKAIGNHALRPACGPMR